MLTLGIKGKEETLVTEANSAKTMESGTLDVFATPAMTALMEKTALDSVAPFLEEGATTVGTALDIRHTAATPVGLEVVCRSTLTAVDGRRLVFSLSVEDACGPVGEGTHERFIVAAAKFQSKADAKAGR